MAKDAADALGTALGKIAREAAKNMAASNGKSSHSGLAEKVTDVVGDRMKNVSGSKGLAAGIGVATVVPLVAKGAGKLVHGIAGNGAGVAEKAGKKVADTAKSAVPGTGGKGGQGMPGVGKGRRMPIQMDIDIGVPIAMVYEHWTKYEDWPNFMHRLDNVSQEDDEHVAFKTKIWGISKQFRAEIVEEQPCERIKWQVTDGVTHTGVVTFHEIGPRLTRVEVNLDVQPGSLIEKAARGMRHVKRAVRADLARFKAYVLMQEQEDSDEPSGSDSTSSTARKRSTSSRSSGGSSGSGSSRSSGGSSSSGTKRRSSSGGSRSSSGSSRSSSNGRSSSTRSRSSSNSRSTSARSGSSSNGRSSSSGRSSNGSSRTTAKKRTAARS